MFRLIKNKESRNIVIRLAVAIFAGISTQSVHSQGNQNPPYPRIFMMHFSQAPGDWYRRFDLVISPAYSILRTAKEAKPEILAFTARDWNVWEKDGSSPSEWWLRRPDGNKFNCGYGYMSDISNYCPPSSSRGGKRYNEYLIDDTLERVQRTYVDGFFCQGIWTYPYNPPDPAVDIDRNGVDDWSEHGKSWMIREWLDGVHVTVSNLYPQMESINKMLILNGAVFHDFEWRYHNGLFLEHLLVKNFNWEYLRKKLRNWMRVAPEPRAMLVDGFSSGKDDFQNMRLLLGFSVMGDGYFSFTDKKSKEHYYNKIYDEYEVNLGYPTSEFYLLSVDCSIRFFDNGVVIMNPSGSEKTVTDAHLRAYSEYDGPYYRFQGGQDPEHNDGSLFSQITLYGAPNGSFGVYGDAVLLLKQPTTVITDIIIDDSDAATSPASERAEFIGNWDLNGEEGDAFYCLCVKTYAGFYEYAFKHPGNGDAKAVYTPTIGTAGNYEVFEWHGEMTSSPVSTRTPFTIDFAKGNRSTGTIDQSINTGQWNSLGTYYFEEGTSGNVTISDDGNGRIIADAFKFVFRGMENDTQEPNPPEALNADIYSQSILLTWEPPKFASDGDRAASYQVFRDHGLVATPFEPRFLDENLTEGTSYSYEIYAVDDAGNRSLTSLNGSFRTVTDDEPPQVLSVVAHSLTAVIIEFNEQIDPISGENIHNYSIHNTPGVTVVDAELLDDLRTIRLITTDHVSGASYILRIENVSDVAATPNSISSVEWPYSGVSGIIEISISADDAYELYVNGELVGSDDEWPAAESYSIPSVAGKNVVAIKGIDLGGVAGLLAEIDFEGLHIVTSENWKIATESQTNWETISFNDALWNKATSYGLHGEASPWANYLNISGISTDTGVEWIWSADNDGDDIVYFRYTLRAGGDIIPPSPPTGVVVTKY